MSAATRRRLDELLDARRRQEMRKGDRGVVEEVREFLQTIDGQAEMGTLPGETMQDVMVRRMMHVDGYDLSLMPGATLKEKHENVEPAYYGKIVVTPEARQAAHVYFGLYDLL